MGYAGLSATAIVDLVNTSRPREPKKHYSNTQLFVNYNAARLFFKDAREDLGGGLATNGDSYRARIVLRAATTAQWTQPYAVTPNVLEEVTGYCGTPRAWFEGHWMFDKREPEMNAEDEQIVKVQNVRRDAAVESIYNLIEQAICSGTQAKTGTAANFQSLFTLLNTLETGTTDNTGGFNGKTFYYDDGTSSTTVLGLDASVVANARWRNWVATYSGGIDAQLVDTIRRARSRTNFQILPELKGDPFRSGGKVTLAMGLTAFEGMTRLANAGSDVRRIDGGNKADPAPFTDVEVCGLPVMPVAAFENVSFSPIVGLNTKHIYGMTASNAWLNEGDPINHQQSHNVFRVPMDGTCLLTTDNRREAGFVIHTVR